MADLSKPVTREKMREYQRAWRAKNLAKHQSQARKRHVAKYGLTVEQLAEMLLAQDGRCKACRVQLGDRYSIDHDHQSGRVRGLLCSKCNTALGMVQDSVERLQALIRYIQQV